MSRLSRRDRERNQMREIERAARLPWQPLVEVPESEFPPQRSRRIVRMWRSNKFLVMEFRSRETEYGLVRHLVVQRITGERIVRWGPLQRIKNEVAGEDAVAIEVYPKARDVVEDFHMYHLWVLPAGYPLPGVGMGLTAAVSEVLPGDD